VSHTNTHTHTHTYAHTHTHTQTQVSEVKMRLESLIRHAALTESQHHAEVSRLNAELEAQAQV
jgi:hypothetical protein